MNWAVRMWAIAGLAIGGLAIGLVVAAWQQSATTTDENFRVACDAIASAFAAPNQIAYEADLRALATVDPGSAEFPLMTLNVLGHAASGDAPTAALQLLRRPEWTTAQRGELRHRLADRLLDLNQPLLAADWLIRQADTTARLDRDVDAAIGMRERAESLLSSAASSGSASVIALRSDNRRRWAGWVAQRYSATAALPLLTADAFADQPDLAPLYRGVIAWLGHADPGVIRALADFTSVTSLARSATANAHSSAAFRLVGSAFLAKHIAPELEWKLWLQRGSWLALGASSAVVVHGDYDTKPLDLPRLALTAQQKHSGIHTTDSVKVAVWTWVEGLSQPATAAVSR